MSTDRIPPHSLDAERAVLGAVLLHNEALDDAELLPGDFYRRAHAQLWATMLALWEDRTAIEAVTLREALTRAGILDEVGGPAYVASLLDGLPQAVNVGFYARIVRDHARRRAVIASANRILESAYQAEEDAERLAERAEAAMREHAERPSFVALDARRQWEAMVEDITQPPTERLWLGIPTLDNIVGGIHAGEVFGVLARPSVGKTLLLGHILRAMACGGAGVVVFSLEMPAAQIVARVARAIYGVDRRGLEYQARSGDGGARYVTALPNTVLIDTPGLSLAKMEAALRLVTPRHLGNVPPKVVLIDHLGLIGGDRAMSTYDRVSTQAREIKELAKRNHCAVVLAIQVNRDQGGDGSKELTLGAARDSGVVEEAMDYMVGCRRMDYCAALSREDRKQYENVLFLHLLKNRHERLGDEFALRLDPTTLAMQEDPDINAPDVATDAVARFRSRR